MSEKNAKPVLTLATRVTILRILGVPVFVLLLLYYKASVEQDQPNEWFRVAALALFVGVALTDALDGYLARSRNEVTTLGRMLDPLADKALLLSGLVLLTRPMSSTLTLHIPLALTLLVVSRDVFLLLGSALVHVMAGQVEVRPRAAGKVATFFQMLTVLWVLIGGPPRTYWWVVWTAGLCTLVSGLQYLIDGLRQVEKAPNHGIRIPPQST